MASIVNLDDTKRAAFVRGFWKGMAAPLMLFSSFSMPHQAAPLEYRPLPRRPDVARSDWARVGDQLRAAAEKVRDDRG
jgi:hypothetical protein